MTNVIFSFDTEDYINPKGADGILRTSRILREYGLRGCYNIVAWLAEALVKWGRTDVIEELRHHEIESHSLRHSHHPTICEYTDIADYDEALALYKKDEQEAMDTIRRIIGNESIYAFCPPGDSISYVTHYGSAQLGVTICDGDALYDHVHGRSVNCCNTHCLEYAFCIDFFLDMEREDILQMIEKMAALETCIVYHHPQKHVITSFCDEMNFNGHNEPQPWALSDLLPEEKTKKFEEHFRFFIETLLKDPRFQIATYADIAKKYDASGRVIRSEDIPALKEALDEDFFPVTVPDSYCISDIFLACQDLLLGKQTHPCDFVYGFLDVPYAISQPVKVTVNEMRESAAQMDTSRFLPTQISVGNKILGPADWLRAALTILCGEEEAVVVPDKWQIDLNQFPRYRDLDLKGTWIHSPELQDAYLSDRYRLQSWTIRLPKGTDRYIL